MAVKGKHEFVSRILVCTGCGEEFAFTADAQKYLAQQGFYGDPKFCKPCNAIRKKEKSL